MYAGTPMPNLCLITVFRSDGRPRVVRQVASNSRISRSRRVSGRAARSCGSIAHPSLVARPGFAAYAEHALADPTTRRWVVRVPVRRDGRPEPREVVRVRVALPQFGWRASLCGTIRASR